MFGRRGAGLGRLVAFARAGLVLSGLPLLIACSGRTEPEALLCAEGVPLGGGRCALPVEGSDGGTGEGPPDQERWDRDAGPRDVAAPDARVLAPVRVEPPALELGSLLAGSLARRTLLVDGALEPRTVTVRDEPPVDGLEIEPTTFLLGTGAQAAVTLELQPSSAGVIASALLVDACGGLCPVAVPIQATIVAEGMRCRPADAGLIPEGTCVVGQLSCVSAVDQEIELVSVVLDGPAFRRPLTPPTTIPPRGELLFEVELCPPAVGDFFGLAELVFEYPGAVEERVAVEVVVRASDEMLTGCRLDIPSSFDFGAVQVGGTTLLPLTLRNDGDRGCALSNLRIEGPMPSEYTIETMGGLVIPPRAADDLLLRFSPTGRGPREARLSFRSDDPNLPEAFIVLTGEGAPPGPATRFDLVRTSPGAPAFPMGRPLAFSDPDDGFAVELLPFPFEFLGAPADRVFVSTNGFITFSQAAVRSSINRAIPNGANPNALVAWFWDDLDLRPNGEVAVILEGTAPNRRFVLLHRGIRAFGGGGVANANTELSARVELHETTNEIVVHYGPTIGTVPAQLAASTGWENATGTLGADALGCGSTCGLADWPTDALFRFIPRP